jgi:O-antigen ligase
LARSGADTPTSVSLGATANQTVQNMSGRNLGSPERLRLLQHSTSLFLENPILGVGVGQMPRYTENGWRAHNTFVTTLVEQGIAGFIGIAAWWIFIFRRTWRGAMREGREFSLSSAVLLALVGIFTVSLFHDQLRTVWNWVVMGIAVEIAMIGLKGLPMKLMTTERQPLLE